MYAETRGSGAVGAEGLVNSEGRRVSTLGQARGAWVQAVDAVGVLFGGKDVRVAREIHVCLVVAEQVRVVKVTVAQKQSNSVFFEFGIVGKAGESEHHLVHFGVTVAADGGNLVLERAQKLDNPLRVVSAGEWVAGPVVKQVSEQKDPFATELAKVRKCLFAGVSRTVNIRKNKSAHANNIAII